MLRATMRLSKPVIAAGCLARPLVAARPLSRSMSTKIVATAFGPDREGVLADFSRAILGVGGTLGGSRAVTVSGTFSVSSVVFLPEDDHQKVAECSWALQTALPDFVTGVRPAITGSAPVVFGEVKLRAGKEYGVVALFAEHVSHPFWQSFACWAARHLHRLCTYGRR